MLTFSNITNRCHSATCTTLELGDSSRTNSRASRDESESNWSKEDTCQDSKPIQTAPGAGNVTAAEQAFNPAGQSGSRSSQFTERVSGGLEVSYWIRLKTDSEERFIPINEADVQGNEKETCLRAHKLFKFLSAKGVGETTSIDEVLELVSTLA